MKNFNILEMTDETQHMQQMQKNLLKSATPSL